jgi:hypothetical protein
MPVVSPETDLVRGTAFVSGIIALMERSCNVMVL